MGVHHDGKIWPGANSADADADGDDNDDTVSDDSDDDNDGDDDDEVSIFGCAPQWQDMASNSSPKFFHLLPCNSRHSRLPCYVFFICICICICIASPKKADCLAISSVLVFRREWAIGHQQQIYLL